MSSRPVIVKWARKALFDQIPLEIIVIDRNLTIIEANRQAQRTYPGWRNKKCYEVLRRKKNKCRGCAAVKTFKDGKTRIEHGQGQDDDGNMHYYMVHVSPYKDEDGNIPYVIEMATDVTDRVKLEREYRQLFDNVPCAISVIDRNFKVIDSNALFRENYKKRGSTYCYEMYKGRDKVCAKCPAVKAFKSKKLVSSVQVGVGKDGKKTHYMVNAAPFVTEGKEVEQVIEMSLDISEIIELKEKLKQVEQEKLEIERFAAVGQTVAGLAHGIKNILMGLEGGMYVVNSGLQRDNNELVERGWHMLQNNVAKISSVVKEYLQFARGSEVELGKADPVAIAREVIDLFQDLAQQNSIEIIADLQEGIEDACLDPDGIHTCLANLVSNAIDACAVSDKKKKRIKVCCFEKDKTIVYEVEDNGTGMDYEVKKKIFSNFFTTKASGQGTGLGLLVTRRIVYEHGGKIIVESKLRKGSIFRILLPRKNLLAKNKLEATK